MPFVFVVTLALSIWTIEAAVHHAWAPVIEFGGTLCSVSAIGTVLRRRRGRPRKFAAPSRAVTLTLPESVIESLSHINRDLSRAIVTLTSRRGRKNGRAAADLSVFGRRAVITIQPSSSLERRAGIELVPLPDGRALIAFDQPKTMADLELVVFDALDDPNLAPADRRIFEGIGSILREARRSTDVTMLQRSIIVIQNARNGHRGPRRALTASR
jgi:hypothetical protein